MVWKTVANLGAAAGHQMLSGLGVAIVLLMMVGIVLLWLQLVEAQRAYRRESRSRGEMEAYLRMDMRVTRSGGVRELAARVCDLVASCSPFYRVAMLLRGADGGLDLVAKTGLDETATGAVERWIERVKESGPGRETVTGGGVRLGTRSLAVWLDEDQRGVVVPISAAADRMVGALVVFASSVLQVRRRAADEAVASLEALAVRLGQAIEEIEIVGKLVVVEKQTVEAARTQTAGSAPPQDEILGLGRVG